MTNKKLLTWFLILAGVLLVILALAAWVIYSHFSRTLIGRTTKTPPDLREARIVKGAEFLSRNQFFTTSQSRFDPVNSIGSIQDISIGELSPTPGIDVVIAARRGAMIVDRNGVKQSQIQYELETTKRKVFGYETETPRTLLGDMQIVDLEGDGACEYLGRGSLDGAAVFDHNGKRRWSYGAYTEEKTSISDLAAGDVNGDGVSEFIAAWDDLEMFDRHGRKVWAQEPERPLYQIEVVDVDGDRKNEIILSTGGELTIKDALGKTVKQVDMPFYFSDFHFCTRPGEKQPHILAVQDGDVWLVDFNGEVFKKFAAPLSRFTNPPDSNDNELDKIGSNETSVYTAKGVWVKFKEDQPEFLAVVTRFAGIDRSVLYVYSDDRRLVYQEVMPEECLSIAVLSAEDGRRTQELLVGGSETVWRYR
jgi:hypothetical protein